MLRIRLAEEGIANHYAEQEMRCPVHLSVGQEAIPVGVSAAMRRDDRVASNHRCHAHYLGKGGSLRAMMAEIYGKLAGCCGGRGGSMHLFDDDVGVMFSQPIVGSSVAVGVGIAYAFQRRGQDGICVAYLGDAAMEEGVFHESANFAALHKIPVVFVCENNLYSVYTPIKQRQPERSITLLATAHGMPASHVDGNDVEAVHGAARAAIDHARSGAGPAFVLADTYRWREHCGPNYDNHIGYRSEDEFLDWKKRCPVERTRARLIARGALTENEYAALVREVNVEIEDSIAVAWDAPLPDQHREARRLCLISNQWSGGCARALDLTRSVSRGLYCSAKDCRPGPRHGRGTRRSTAPARRRDACRRKWPHGDRDRVRSHGPAPGHGSSADRLRTLGGRADLQYRGQDALRLQWKAPFRSSP